MMMTLTPCYAEAVLDKAENQSSLLPLSGQLGQEADRHDNSVVAPTKNELAPENASCIRRDDEGRFLGWMDYKHCVFSGRTLAAANWFDDLFGDWNDKEASLFINAIAEQFFSEGGVQTTRFTVRASADLPKMKQRFRLVVFDEGNEDPASPLSKKFSEGQSAALRWLPKNFLGVQSDFDIGIKGANPPDVFARFRLRRSWPFMHDYVVRASQTFRYGSAKKKSEVSQLDVERALGESAVIRLGNVVSYEQRDASNGLYFGHGLSVSHTLTHQRSLSYGISLSGRSEPNWRREAYSAWLVWRGSFLRPWLFYELEPSQTYERINGWEPRAAIALRVEAQLGQWAQQTTTPESPDNRHDTQEAVKPLSPDTLNAAPSSNENGGVP